MRKLLSIMLAAAFLFSVLPTAFAVSTFVETDTEIGSVSISDVTTELYDGMLVGDYFGCTLNTPSCTLTSSKWYDDTSSRYAAEDDTFIKDHAYSFHIVVTPDEGVTIADDVVAEINDDTDNVDYVVLLADGSVRIESVTFICTQNAESIDFIEIDGATLELYDGMVAGDCMDITCNDDNYSIVETMWVEVTGYPVFPDAQFTAGKTYYMTITFDANEGYTFTDDTQVTINGSEDNVRAYMLTSYGYFIVSTQYIICEESIGTTIKTVAITDVETELHDGQHAGDYTLCTMNTPHCTVTSCKWYDDTASKYLADDDTFVTNREYSFHVVLTPDEGYEFAQDVTVTINGSADNVEYIIPDADGSVRVESVLFTCGENLGKIDHVALTDVIVEPFDGMTVGECSGCTCGSDEYELTDIIWLSKSGPMLDDNQTFEKGQEYHCVITIAPADGHVFTDETTVTINGSDEYIDRISITYYGSLAINTIDIICPDAPDICTPVAVVSITDAETTPKAGERCGDYLSCTIPEDAPYEVTSALWYDMTNDKPLNEDDVFEEGTEYSIAFCVETKEGYCFNEDTVLMLNDSPELHRYSGMEDTKKAWIYSIPEEAKADEPPVDDILIGDCNGDGKINTLDAVAILKHAAGMMTLEGDSFTAADINKDEKVNTVDAVFILKFAAGMIESL